MADFRRILEELKFYITIKPLTLTKGDNFPGFHLEICKSKVPMVGWFIKYGYKVRKNSIILEYNKAYFSSVVFQPVN
jgi:hypothetical protein